MNPLIGESRNMLKAGKVIGPISDPRSYHDRGLDRGDPKFPMGRSSLMEFDRCPKRWLDGYESEESKATEWGSLVDCLFLTPDQFKNLYAIAPENYPDSKTGEMKPWNANSNWCKAWIEEHSDKEVIKNKLFSPACDAVKRLESDSEIKGLLDCSQRQVMATATYCDEETGITVPIHILIDLLPDKESKWGKSIVDFKTTESASMRKWRSKVYQFNYDAQSALYLDVWTATTGEDRQDFRHIIQESYAPYQTEIRLMSAEFIEIGRMKYVNALKRYCQCLKTGIWPGYDADCRTIDGWQLTEPEPWMVQ